MFNTTRRFVVLSQSVNTSDDVFNTLIEVQDKTTGEQGLLLCSHMCNWPQELISQATWLEGCKTPELYKDEPRLALGYHPEQYTQWRVFKELNEVEIYLTGSWNQGAEEEDDQYVTWLTTGLTRPNQSFSRGANSSRNQFSPVLFRLADRITGRYNYASREEKQARLDNLESVLHRLINTSRVSAWEATVFPYFYFTFVLPSWAEIHWEGPLDLFLGVGLFAYADGGVYSEESNLLPYSRTENSFTVTASNPEAGFFKAISFEVTYDTYQNDGLATVHYCNPDDFLADELQE